jgi:hypothetical protein
MDSAGGNPKYEISMSEPPRNVSVGDNPKYEIPLFERPRDKKDEP